MYANRPIKMAFGMLAGVHLRAIATHHAPHKTVYRLSNSVVDI
jgi:hypothetical protein